MSSVAFNQNKKAYRWQQEQRAIGLAKNRENQQRREAKLKLAAAITGIIRQPVALEV